MALFKILKGPEKKDSTGTSVMLNPTASGLAIHEGWAYITNEGNFYVDISDSTRLKINQNADYAIVANKDSSNQTIVSTYIKGINFVVDNSIQAGSKSNPYLRYTIGNGTTQNIALPAASSTQGGILTAATQTIAGNKTFNNNVTVKGTLTASNANGLVYSGIQADTEAGTSKYVWFSTTGGIPKYNTGFSFNPECTTAWGSYDSGTTATAYTELKVGRVNGIALKALQDDSGQIIKNTYIKDVILKTDPSAPYYTLTLGNGASKDNDGTAGVDKVIIPVASATQAGIITADKANAQTITGSKIIDANGSLEIKKSGGFNYSGIQDGTSAGSRSVWFSNLNYSGTPCINASFRFDPTETLNTTDWSNEASGTKSSVLHVPHINGLAYKALRDSQGLVIDDTYIKDVVLTNHATAPYYTLTLGNSLSKTNADGTTQKVLLPVAGSSYGGIITNAAQSISGKKTFSDGIAVKLTATNTSATYYPWFSTVNSNGVGTPVYDTNFSYNASTNKLTATTFAGSLEGNAASATKLTSSAGSTTQPIYFSDGKPVAITGAIANSTTGNAATATALTTSAGSTTQPVYFSGGKPVAITGTINNNSASADRILYKSNHTEAASGTTGSSPAEGLLYTSGLFLTGTYSDSNTPVSFGNIINIAGTGTGQLLCEWQGVDNVAGHLYYRSHRDTSTGGWSPWVTILDSSNYNGYSPSLTGTGASGTWSINITGNSATATNADQLDGYHEYNFLRVRDVQSGDGGTTHINSLWSQIGIRQYNNALPDGMGDNATYTWGEIVSLPGYDSRLDIWCNHHSSETGDLWFRSGWGDDKKAWAKILNTANYTGILDANYVKKSGDTMTGNLTAPSVYTSNWFRSTGTTGWYNESYGGGIWMNDSTWIRTYGNKNFYCDATMGSGAHLYTDGYFRCSGDSYTYGHTYIGGSNKIHLWEDEEGGNIQILSGNGTEVHMDMYDNQNFRIYSWNDAGNYVGISMRRSDGHFFANAVHNAVWNDYAECREANTEEPGRVLFEKGDDTLEITNRRLQAFAGVSSDTYGVIQGETKKAKTPIAVAGRVLVYTYQDRNNYKPGDCVCAAPGGTVDIMTREEVIKYPDRIVGTVSCVPTYEEWGTGKVKVNGRIWIKVK